MFENSSARVSLENIVHWALAALLLYVCFFSQLDALGLLGPDEPRYAAIAQEMSRTGDWVTPRLHGKGWFEKPVLYYWTAGAAFRWLGEGETSARLPSALAALITALALAYAARMYYGGGAAWAVMLIFPTSVGVFAFARAATTDMLFSAALCLSMLSAAQLLGPWRGTAGAACLPLFWQRTAFGGLLGLAALAKGPAALALAGGSVALWTLATRRWRDSLRLLHPVSILVFFAVAAPWYVLVSLRNREFVDVFLIAHNFERYLTPVFRHEQPVWFFGPVLALGLVPWTALLVAVARAGWELKREKRWQDSAGFFFACWVIFPLVFFSLSKSKLPGYVLPAIPPLALLFARCLSAEIGGSGKKARAVLAGVGATLILLALSAGYWLKRLPPETGFQEPAHFVPALAAVAAAGAGIIVAALLGRSSAAFLSAAILMAGLVECTNRVVLPQLDPHLSARAAAEMTQTAHSGMTAPHVFQMHRAWHYGLNYYHRQELREWDPRTGEPAWVYTPESGIAEIQSRGVPYVVVSRITPRVALVRVEGRAR